MMTVALDPVPGFRTIEELQTACLEKIIDSPSGRDAQNAVLDLYLETVKRVENGWTLSSVLTNASIRLKHL